ncbi:MAG: sigma-70 family RNA polymerase sigma factor [Planctomycetes bacterium]|nr:sigma-70 family RNA polymerase sigma factor [Planctomycetota bacterium]
MTDPLPVVQAEMLRHAEQLKGFIAALVADRDAAEDCFQELFLTITAKAADFTPGTDFLAWACTIARYKVLQHLERRRRHAGCLDPATIAALAADADAFHDAWGERRDALAICLERLPPAARRLIDARYVHGLAPAAIAAASGRTANGVSVALAKARDALESCIGHRLAGKGG